MRYTIFDTPIISPILHGVSVFLLKIFGWRTEGQLPDLPKYVIVGAYHTSNWDFPFAVMFAFVLRIRICWMGKNSLFRWPFRSFFRWVGGIPIERSQHHGVVGETIRAFKENERLIMVITPEGTRRRVQAWKKGFYYIALNAKAPILLAFLDYRRKVAGIGPLITPSGDIEADMEILRDFFANVTPRHPERATIPFVETKPSKNTASTDP